MAINRKHLHRLLEILQPTSKYFKLLKHWYDTHPHMQFYVNNLLEAFNRQILNLPGDSIDKIINQFLNKKLLAETKEAIHPNNPAFTSLQHSKPQELQATYLVAHETIDHLQIQIATSYQKLLTTAGLSAEQFYTGLQRIQTDVIQKSYELEETLNKLYQEKFKDFFNPNIAKSCQVLREKNISQLLQTAMQNELRACFITATREQPQTQLITNINQALDAEQIERIYEAFTIAITNETLILPTKTTHILVDKQGLYEIFDEQKHVPAWLVGGHKSKPSERYCFIYDLAPRNIDEQSLAIEPSEATITAAVIDEPPKLSAASHTLTEKLAKLLPTPDASTEQLETKLAALVIADSPKPSPVKQIPAAKAAAPVQVPAPSKPRSLTLFPPAKGRAPALADAAAIDRAALQKDTPRHALPPVPGKAAAAVTVAQAASADNIALAPIRSRSKSLDGLTSSPLAARDSLQPLAPDGRKSILAIRASQQTPTLPTLAAQATPRIAAARGKPVSSLYSQESRDKATDEILRRGYALLARHKSSQEQRDKITEAAEAQVQRMRRTYSTRW